MRDILLTVTTAFPAANANVNSSSLDLQGVLNGRANPELDIPALPSLANATTATFSIQDSPNGSSGWQTVDGYGNLTRLGAGGVGAAAILWRLALHPHLKRYVRVNIAVANSGGDNTAVSATLAVGFPAGN